MSKIKFVLSIATILGVAFILSCSDKVDEANCAVSQGDWDSATKKCVKCPAGTTINADKQCIAAPIVDTKDDKTISICPELTKLDEKTGKCIAEIIATDPEAVAGIYYCDYGDKCVKTEYESECDGIWGKIVPSCKENDRRKDTLKYCDYGFYCHQILNDNECKTEYGKITDKCSENSNNPGGTGTTPPETSSNKYCSYGDNKCELIDSLFFTEGTCAANSGKVVKDKQDCGNYVVNPPSDSTSNNYFYYCCEKSGKYYEFSNPSGEKQCIENSGKVVKDKQECLNVAPSDSTSNPNYFYYCCMNPGNYYQINSTSNDEATKCTENSGKVIKDKQECVNNGATPSDSTKYCSYGNNKCDLIDTSLTEKKCNENSGKVVNKQECVNNGVNPPSDNYYYYCREKSGNCYQINSSEEKKCIENSGTVVKDTQTCNTKPETLPQYYYCCYSKDNYTQISSDSGDEATKCKENSGKVVKDKLECIQ